MNESCHTCAYQGQRRPKKRRLLFNFLRYVFCSVLQCDAVWCSVLQCVAECCSVVQCVAECCSVLQCVAVCCSVLQCVAVCPTCHSRVMASIDRHSHTMSHDSHSQTMSHESCLITTNTHTPWVMSMSHVNESRIMSHIVYPMSHVTSHVTSHGSSDVYESCQWFLSHVSYSVCHESSQWVTSHVPYSVSHDSCHESWLELRLWLMLMIYESCLIYSVFHESCLQVMSTNHVNESRVMPDVVYPMSHVTNYVTSHGSRHVYESCQWFMSHVSYSVSHGSCHESWLEWCLWVMSMSHESCPI